MITEVCYLLGTRLGPAAEADFLTVLARQEFELVPPAPSYLKTDCGQLVNSAASITADAGHRAAAPGRSEPGTADERPCSSSS